MILLYLFQDILTFNKCSINVLYHNVDKNQQEGLFSIMNHWNEFFQQAEEGSENDEVTFFQDYNFFFINKIQSMTTLNQVNLKKVKT